MLSVRDGKQPHVTRSALLSVACGCSNLPTDTHHMDVLQTAIVTPINNMPSGQTLGPPFWLNRTVPGYCANGTSPDCAYPTYPSMDAETRGDMEQLLASFVRTTVAYPDSALAGGAGGSDGGAAADEAAAAAAASAASAASAAAGEAGEAGEAGDPGAAGEREQPGGTQVQPGQTQTQTQTRPRSGEMQFNERSVYQVPGSSPPQLVLLLRGGARGSLKASFCSVPHAAPAPYVYAAASASCRPGIGTAPCALSDAPSRLRCGPAPLLRCLIAFLA
jgi:hypothetical protein